MKEQIPENSWQYWSLVASFFLLGTFFLFNAKGLLDYGNSVKKWPTTLGKIEKLEVYTNYIKRYKTGTIPVLGIRISYKYVVNGQIFDSSRVTPSGKYESKDFHAINKLKSLLSKQKSIKVYYNPRDPNISLIIPELSNNFFGFFIVGLILILISLSAIVFFILAKIKERKKERMIADH